MDTPYYNPKELSRDQLRAAVASILHRVPTGYAPILQARYGIDLPEHSIAETTELLRATKAVIHRAEATAMRILLHPAQQELVRSIVEVDSEPAALRLEVRYAVECIRQLTPELIRHLQQNDSDLLAVRWDVFEHLVAELLVSAGFQDVSLVGRNAGSAADIFAAWKVGPLGISMRYFIEVKRWKDRVGVEVVDHVYGAMLAERQVHGWHAALIVSVVGFRDFKKYSRETLKNLGVELKDKADVLNWLAGYRPDQNGLWLPRPRRGLPTGNAT